MNTLIAALKLLFFQPFYLFLAIVLSILLFVIYFVLNNFPTFASVAAISLDPSLLWKVFTNQVNMIWEVSGPLNVLAVVAVAVLAGVNISLTIFRVRRTGVLVERRTFLGLLGVFGGSFGAACAACQTALIGLILGSGGLALFPFKGLEISLLAIFILLVSLFYTSKSLVEFGIVNPK